MFLLKHHEMEVAEQLRSAPQEILKRELSLKGHIAFI